MVKIAQTHVDVLRILHQEAIKARAQLDVAQSKMAVKMMEIYAETGVNRDDFSIDITVGEFKKLEK